MFSQASGCYFFIPSSFLRIMGCDMWVWRTSRRIFYRRTRAVEVNGWRRVHLVAARSTGRSLRTICCGRRMHSLCGTSVSVPRIHDVVMRIEAAWQSPHSGPRAFLSCGKSVLRGSGTSWWPFIFEELCLKLQVHVARRLQRATAYLAEYYVI